MIDDWVLYKNKPAKITLMHKTSFTDVISVYYKDDKFDVADIEELSGIKITPEIIESIGFIKVCSFDTKNECELYKHSENKSFFIYKKDNEKDIILYFYMGELEIKIKYVHELQNVMNILGLNSNVEL